MNELEYCFGCLRLLETQNYSPPDATRRCVYLNPNSNGNCPCTLCIVKAMCIVNCADFYTFSQTNTKLRNDGSIS